MNNAQQTQKLLKYSCEEFTSDRDQLDKKRQTSSRERIYLLTQSYPSLHLV